MPSMRTTVFESRFIHLTPTANCQLKLYVYVDHVCFHRTCNNRITDMAILTQKSETDYNRNVILNNNGNACQLNKIKLTEYYLATLGQFQKQQQKQQQQQRWPQQQQNQNSYYHKQQHQSNKSCNIATLNRVQYYKYLTGPIQSIFLNQHFKPN